MYHYILVMGGIYRLPRGKYKKLLMKIGMGEEPTQADYGRYLGPLVSVTDMSDDEAQDRLVTDFQIWPCASCGADLPPRNRSAICDGFANRVRECVQMECPGCRFCEGEDY